MNTEITDIKDTAGRDWVFFDGHCPRCRRWAERFRIRLERAGFVLAPLQSAAARAALELSDEELLAEMKVIRNGTIHGGADALVCLAESIGGGKVVSLLARTPGMSALLRSLYRLVARNRSCDGGACRAERKPTRKRSEALNWLPIAVLVPTVVIVGREYPAWLYMWMLTFALYAGCKWLSYRSARYVEERPTFARRLGYLFAWPGMDAEAFMKVGASVAKPVTAEWIFLAAKILLGLLIWEVAEAVFPGHPLLAGWLGMIGLIFVLHFGLLELCALLWRDHGVDALPLMREPLKSHSLGEFWGCRWNTGFHHLADRFVFRPLRPVFGLRGATLAVFGISGLLHELVISVPARGGYGLPTAYFLLQGTGVLFERSRLARRLGVGRHGRGWLFTMMVTAGPAYWLFHPPFVLNVIVPFLQFIRVI